MLSFSDLKVGRSYIFHGLVGYDRPALVNLVAVGFHADETSPFIAISTDVTDTSGRHVDMSIYRKDIISDLVYLNYHITGIDSSASLEDSVFCFGSIGIDMLEEL